MKKFNFTFIDLFAGIGGIRIAFESFWGECVFSSEIDKYCQETYRANFGETPFGDIYDVIKNGIDETVKDHDILTAGFPCQAFSIAGRRQGFEDTRGTLFFAIAKILQAKKPKAFLLENVKGLVNHSKGKTLERILDVLRNELDYYVPDPKIINAKDFGVPQNRERVYIVGFRKDLGITEFTYPKPLKSKRKLKDILETEPVSVKYYLSDVYLNSLREHRRRHESKGHGFGFEILNPEGVSNALVVGGMGRERNLVIDKKLKDYMPVTKIKGKVNREGIRRLTPREWARLQGFGDDFVFPVSDAQKYKQLGNSVAIPAVKSTAEVMLKLLEKHL